jgi:hypothetical protein
MAQLVATNVDTRRFHFFCWDFNASPQTRKGDRFFQSTTELTRYATAIADIALLD